VDRLPRGLALAVLIAAIEKWVAHSDGWRWSRGHRGRATNSRAALNDLRRTARHAALSTPDYFTEPIPPIRPCWIRHANLSELIGCSMHGTERHALRRATPQLLWASVPIRRLRR
jgi:hypothetical protein